MEPVHLFKLGFEKLGWLSARQAVVAENVANADVPGFEARDVEPFESALSGLKADMATTDPRHMRLDDVDGADVVHVGDGHWGVSLSGNGVSMEELMTRQASIATDQAMVTSTLRSFHRLMMMSVRG